MTDNQSASQVENTSNRDPLIHVVGAFSDPDRYILEMEAAGQSQLVNSTELPTKMNSGTDDDLRALGFVLGDPNPSDPMFRPVQLPDGWRKEGTDHSMWSKVVDQLGRPRLSVFYKAAFYDREAFINVETVEGYAWSVIYGAKPVFDDEWATPEKVRAAVQERRDQWVRDQEVYASEYTAEQIANADKALASLPGGES